MTRKLRIIPSQKRLRAIALLDYLEDSAEEHHQRCVGAYLANEYARLARRG